MTVSETTKLASPKQLAERSLIWLGAITTGVVVTNLFAPQILVGLIGRSLDHDRRGRRASSAR